MNLKDFNKETIKRIAKRVKGQFGPPEHTDEELGAGDYAAGDVEEGGGDLQDTDRILNSMIPAIKNAAHDADTYADRLAEAIQSGKESDIKYWYEAVAKALYESLDLLHQTVDAMGMEDLKTSP